MYSYHGTAVAGIIGANANNSVGIAGIAPNCQLMDISLNNYPAYNYQNADGIDKAWRNGADVINNCWSWDPAVRLILIDEAIDSALQRGRGGKGCVVVFSAGNDNNPIINYPSDYHPDIIVVGSIFDYGEKTATNYGNHLDIVAPGYEIRTTL
jgi:subtilisin family serine protease